MRKRGSQEERFEQGGKTTRALVKGIPLRGKRGRGRKIPGRNPLRRHERGETDGVRKRGKMVKSRKEWKCIRGIAMAGKKWEGGSLGRERSLIEKGRKS